MKGEEGHQCSAITVQADKNAGSNIPPSESALPQDNDGWALAYTEGA